MYRLKIPRGQLHPGSITGSGTISVLRSPSAIVPDNKSKYAIII